MKKMKGYLLSGAIIAGAAAFVWMRLLDERAKESLRGTASKTAGLANKLVSSYMGNPDEVQDEQAAEANRDWVRYQWEQAGY